MSLAAIERKAASGSFRGMPWGSYLKGSEMKKILLATTVLGMTAGFASAEVTLSGDARMGILDAGGSSTAEFTSRARVKFTASGETDNGLSFGAELRADNAGDAAKGTAGTVFVSGAFGKLSMGDVDSAFGATFGNIAGVGLTGLGDKNELSHSADGGAFGKVPEIYTKGVVTLDAYDSFFSLNAAKTDYVGKAADVATFGSNAALVWGRLFDSAAFTASTSASDGTASTPLTDAELATTGLNIYPTTPSAGRFDVVDFENAVGAGFAAAVDKAALEKGLIPSDTAAADFLALLGTPGARNIYTVDRSSKKEGRERDEQDWVEYLDFSIDSSAVKAIPAKVLYQYSVDAFSVAASYSQMGKAEAYSIAGAYNVNNLKVSLGYASAEWDDAIVATITGFGNVVADPVKTAKFTISNTHDLSAEDVNLGVSYKFDAVTVSAVAQRKTFDLNGAEIDQLDSTGLSVAYSDNGLGVNAFVMSTDAASSERKNIYGFGGSYELGGGASVMAGVVGGDTDTSYDVGLSFKF